MQVSLSFLNRWNIDAATDSLLALPPSLRFRGRGVIGELIRRELRVVLVDPGQPTSPLFLGQRARYHAIEKCDGRCGAVETAPLFQSSNPGFETYQRLLSIRSLSTTLGSLPLVVLQSL